MDESKISVRYAKALLSLAREKKLLEAVKTDMEIIFQLFESTPGFSQLLESPVVGTNEKRKLFENVFANRINALTYSFLALLVTNNREAMAVCVCIRKILISFTTWLTWEHLFIL